MRKYDNLRQKLVITAAMLFIISLLTACGYLIPSLRGQDINLIYTSAAKTFAVEHSTQTPQPSQTNTPIPSPSSTITPLNQQTTNPTATMTSTISCYSDAEITDENIPDGTKFQPGESFEKTWEFYNSGTCRWNEDFSLVFINGRRMGGTTVYLEDRVSPGDYIEITVELTAPSSKGEYIGTWQLLDQKGALFGEKSSVDIEVIDKYTATPTRTMTRTMTITMTRTITPSPTSTRTRTPTLTSTYTFTPTLTSTSSPTATSTTAPTETETPTPSPTSSNTVAPSETNTPTITPSPT